MVTTGAMMFGNVPRRLDFDRAEHPVALELGGSAELLVSALREVEPQTIADAA